MPAIWPSKPGPVNRPFNCSCGKTLNRRKVFLHRSAVLYDLDGDGLPEIILAAKNLVIVGAAKIGTRPSRYVAIRPTPSPALSSQISTEMVSRISSAPTPRLILIQRESTRTFDEPGRLAWPPVLL